MSELAYEPHPKSVSPWTDEEVDSINAWQESNAVHPFTCPCDHPETDDHVSLVATEASLFCPECDYEQNWVHGFMVDGTIYEILAHPFLATSKDPS